MKQFQRRLQAAAFAAITGATLTAQKMGLKFWHWLSRWPKWGWQKWPIAAVAVLSAVFLVGVAAAEILPGNCTSPLRRANNWTSVAIMPTAALKNQARAEDAGECLSEASNVADEANTQPNVNLAQKAQAISSLLTVYNQTYPSTLV